MDFKNYLKQSAEEIDLEINSFLRSWEGSVKEISSKLVPLNQAFQDACQEGKRLRGSLVKLGYELVKRDSTAKQELQLIIRQGGFQNDGEKDVIKAAVAYEIFQTAILAHDDIIDKSDLRRGKPTLYKALGGDYYGLSQTICLGDIGFFLSLKLIAESSFPEKEKNLALNSFIRTVLDTALGEMLDIEIPHSHLSSGNTDVMSIFRLKTARYTIVGPLQLGVILGGGSQKILNNIQDFGEKLGIAFQIQDDILGVFGDEKVLGKSVTSDIEEGKNTLLIIHALKYANPKQREVLDKYYGKGKVSKEEHELIKKVFIETGALSISEEQANKLVEEAKKVIENMEIPEEKRNLLLEMADFLVKRDK